MATNASALPAQEPNAVADIRSVLQSQQEAWNRGDIDGFMNGYSRSASTVFVSEDSVKRGWENVRERYREKYADRAKMGTLIFSDAEVTLLASDAAVVLGRWSCSGQKIIRTGASPSSSNACRKAGELCTIIRRRLRSRSDL